MQKLFALYETEDLLTQARLAISEMFITIAKNIGLRKIFLKPENHKPLFKNALMLVEAQSNPNQRLAEISINAIKVLCTVCTVKTNRFYIPGETSISERLRKNSFDCGSFTLLHYIVKYLQDGNPWYAEVKQYIREKVLNFVELNDLQYHAKILKTLQENPQSNQEDAVFKENNELNSPAAIWAETPQLRFPASFLTKLELESMHDYICERIEVVKVRIDKRKEEDIKKKLEKQQQIEKEQETLAEQKRKRHEEINNKRDFQKKMGMN